MYTQLLRAKLHHARVTSADKDYIGSITIDGDLLEQSGMLPYEKVQVVDVENGNRIETYIIEGEHGSGVIQLNGAAAHLVTVGDRLIIMAYALVELPLTDPWIPKVALLNEENKITQWLAQAKLVP